MRNALLRLCSTPSVTTTALGTELARGMADDDTSQPFALALCTIVVVPWAISKLLRAARPARSEQAASREDGGHLPRGAGRERRRRGAGRRGHRGQLARGVRARGVREAARVHAAAARREDLD